MALTPEQAADLEQRAKRLHESLDKFIGSVVDLHNASANTTESMARMRRVFGIEEPTNG